MTTINHQSAGQPELPDASTASYWLWLGVLLLLLVLGRASVPARSRALAMVQPLRLVSTIPTTPPSATVDIQRAWLEADSQ